nr:multiple epidermal growth factor-like domains protein 10 isoform X2 [Crassostrea gigas]XP_034313037.1 multiple epidermal growth factor-like domains protein 10 isoform X2 [Crassostrea gigas]XP_034313038.1 multiple epidermal growth factor-like domains protein 10 isoform X2 [Crassostrea gigas]XP_034313039.1 multiple epidermal growth factor-like domains protein 10 isoform X2 [Crassostrea gigas]XP_034313040.1 multiple epidermal growth factor-like domains protein 10 isoform X2 [Crassostrea gigas]
MKSLWIYMLVILVSVKYVASQCIGNTTCDCHCFCCSPVCLGSPALYCTSCAKGWSGTTNNGCQRQNVAYNTSVENSSTASGSFPPKNAVDENDRTYVLSKTEENPKLKITLSKIFNIKSIYVAIYAEGYNTRHNIYVTKTTSMNLSMDNLCGSIYQAKSDLYGIDITCLEGKILTGDQIVIQEITTWGRIRVHDVRVYQCSQGTYGDQCDRECRNCVGNRCDGYTGACERGCNIGWQGATCGAKCSTNCRENICDQNTGFCTVGCKPEWYGEKCDRQCPSLCESPCDRYLGCRHCQIGFNGPNCNPCDGKTHGKNCSLICQNCNDCNNVNGCRECFNGFYGNLCEIECPKQCRNDICYRQSGVCKGGCKDGYAGTKCDTPCKDNCATCSTDAICISCLSGRFGTNCEYLCPGTCGGSKTCDKNSGVCSECNPGTFGPNCTQQCSNNCLTGIPSVCDRNGTCISGCVDGWFGPLCDTLCPTENCEICNSSDFSCEICNIGYYLDNVQEIRKCVKCPSKYVSCNSDLRCTECIPKFTGYQCENECTINCVDDLFKCEY